MERKWINRKINALCRRLIKRFGGLLSDKAYIKATYRLWMHQKLDLSNPRSFTEKLQWLKLYDHNPLYTSLVDKFEVKKWVSEKIGEKYVIPTIGVWNSLEDITWENLPNQFVLKTTFGGGSDGVFICNDKKKVDKDVVMQKMGQSMKTNPYKRVREWPYKNVPLRLIAEQYLEDKSGDLADYKFYCFDGVPKVLLMATNRYTAHNFDYFDMDFNRLSIVSAMGGNNLSLSAEKPACFDEMKEIAHKLSDGFPHVRVDLYCCNGHVYFGEMTLYDSSGFDNLNSEEWNMRFGSWIKLPAKKTN